MLELSEEERVQYHKLLEKIAAKVLEKKETRIIIELIPSDISRPDLTTDEMHELNLELYKVFSKWLGRDYHGTASFDLVNRYYYVQNEGGEIRNKVVTDAM